MKNKNIGTFPITLTNDQLKILTQDGAKILDEARKEENSGTLGEVILPIKVRRGPTDPKRKS